MEAPPAYMTDAAAAAAASWQVVGHLLRQGRPAHPSELAWSFSPFSCTPNFLRFLCSIPDSPLHLAGDDFVTFSRRGVAALAQFFANSHLITGDLDMPQFMPRLSAEVRSNGLVRIYCRKRKRVAAERGYNRLNLEFDDEKNSSQMEITIPYKFPNVVAQGTEALSSLPSLPGFENEHFAAEVHNMQRFSCLHRMNSECYSLNLGRTPFLHRITAEQILIFAPSSKLYPMNSTLEEGGGISDIGIVDPVATITISPSYNLDEQMIVKREKNDDATLGFDSLTEGVDGKIKEVLVQGSGSCKGHNEYRSGRIIHKMKCDKDNPEKALPESNNKGHFIIRPRTEGHLQSLGDELNHSIKHSSGLSPDKKSEAHERKKAICPANENCKCLSDKGQEQCERKNNSSSIRQTKKINCDQIVNFNEKRETSIENRERPSSISSNIEQATFPEFELFVVEQEEGSGGYGTVYRAKRKADGEIFAIKCPHVNANKNSVKNEMKMLERLGGKNFVIKYEGSFKSGSADCLVLQHVPHDRPEILKREMNVADLQWYAYCLFKALAGLHRQDIVHRDVKPGNFLYSRKLNKGYLIDFNLALDMRKKYGTFDNCKVYPNLYDPTAICQTKSLSPAKSRKSMETACTGAVNNNAGKVRRSLLSPGNLKRKVDETTVITEGSNWNIIKSQGADGSGITSAKDATSTRTVSAERLREPLPCHGRKELLSLVQEAMQGANHDTVDAPKSKRKRVNAPAGDAGSKRVHVTPMPLHDNGSAIRGAGFFKNKGGGKPAREGPCAGTKGFKAPEVLFRSPHQGPKADIWSAGVTLLYLMIGRTPFAGVTEQNIKDIAKLRGSEDLWEVAKLHNNESLFPKALLDVKYLSPVSLREWCARNAQRKDLIDALPRSLFDLIDKCLMVNPRLRISAEEAIGHEFFAPCKEALRKHRVRRQALSMDSKSSHRSSYTQRNIKSSCTTK